MSEQPGEVRDGGARDGLLHFPEGFAWGAATASYQIEGAVAEGGRGPSIWDTFSHTPGAVTGGHTGNVADDHYHRYQQDVALLAELGASHYRFSIAWPRLQPEGRGKLNPAGVDFYSRLVEALLGAGIEPWVTLYHWDLPQALEDAGGWPHRDTASRFADYAAAIHLLLGHGLALQALRAQDARSTLGITLNLFPVDAASDAAADVDAARRVDGLANRLFLDPLLRGRYPADVLEDVGGVGDRAHLRDGDEATIATPFDVLGVNYYFRHVVRAGGAGRPGGPSPWVGSGDVEFVSRGLERTAMGWEVDPQGLYDVLVRVHRDYGPLPLYITENGAAFADEPGPDGAVSDPARVRYLDGHFRAAHRAIADGVDLRGYFVWSLLDNFEWAQGYTKRFGLYYVDYPTQRRIPKDSARWFAGVTSRNALPAAG